VADTASRPPVRERATRQRAAIAAALRALPGFATAAEIHAGLAAGGQRVGLATVYRSLTRMAERGELDTVTGGDGQLRYRMCSGGHHHHLVCTHCGWTAEIAAAEVEQWAEATAASHAFTPERHVIEVFGRCQDCAPPNRRSRSA